MRCSMARPLALALALAGAPVLAPALRHLSWPGRATRNQTGVEAEEAELGVGRRRGHEQGLSHSDGNGVDVSRHGSPRRRMNQGGDGQAGGRSIAQTKPRSPLARASFMRKMLACTADTG